MPPDRAGSDTELPAEVGVTRVAFVGLDEVLLERSAAVPLEEVVARLSAPADVTVVEGYRDESMDGQLHLMGTLQHRWRCVRVTVNLPGERLPVPWV